VEWVLDLASWIIQDGNYDEVTTGDHLDAAVEFGFEDAPTLTEAESPSASHDSGSTYDVAGRVELVEPEVWVVDIGITVFNEAPPPRGVAVGDRVAGKFWLGVAHSLYRASLSGMPALIYSWRVVEILQQTAPFVPGPEPRTRVRDASRLGWKTIERTNAWTDDDGSADYLLRCELLPEPLRRARS
jgi:hypothetical protein